MLDIFNIPPINPVMLYWQSEVLNTAAYTQAAYKSFDPNQNERGIDNDFYLPNLKSWMDKVGYAQPYQQGDKLTLQWLGVANYITPAVENYVVRIIDVNGTIIKQQNALQGSEVGVGSGIYIRSISMLLFDIPEGKYFVQIHKVGIFADYDYFMISEPIWIKAYWPDTMLIRYKHSENAYDVFWETGIEMWIRVHAAFTQLDPSSQFNVYDDDIFNLTLLSGVKYRIWQLTFGVGMGNNKMPSYMFDKLEEIMLCDSLFIDHKNFTRIEESKLEIEPVEKNPLGTATIKVREKINNANQVVNYYPPIILGPAPTSEWFSVGFLTQTTPATSYPIFNYFNGAKNFVQYLNAVNIGGIVDFVNTYFALDTLGNIVLLTNDDDVYADFSPGLIYEDLLEGHIFVDVEPLGTELDLVVQYVNSIVSSKYRYYWGDGTSASGSGTGATKTKTYTSGVNRKARLFWDQAEEIYLDASEQIIKTLEGKCPLRTQIFDCSDNQLKLIKNNIFAAMGAYPSNTNFQLWGNQLSQAAIDAIHLFAYDARLQFDTPAAIDVQVQVPSAIPSTEMSIIISRLSAAGITILTD